MKRFSILLVTLILILGITIGKSQSSLNLGVKGGASISNFTGNNVSQSGLLTTFSGGAFINYTVAPWFALQPEANLSFKGSTYDVQINGFPYHRVTVVYAQVPLLLQFSSPEELKNTGFRPSVFVGPAVNFRFNAELDGMPLQNVDGGYSLNQKTEPMVFEMVGGIGGTINDLYVVDLRYGHSLSDIFKTGDVKASSIALTIGFKF